MRPREQAYCEGCLHQGRQGCEVPAPVPEAIRQRVCQAASWRQERPAEISAVRRTKSTGEWADFLEKF
jgi:hypothetical protein